MCACQALFSVPQLDRNYFVSQAKAGPVHKAPLVDESGINIAIRPTNLIVTNRRYAEIHLESNSNQMDRYGRPLGVLLMDVGHFD